MTSIHKHLRAFLALAIAACCISATVSGSDDKKWDTPPAVKKSVAPDNPNKIEGMVSATITISTAGQVVSSEISRSTDDSLNDPVLKALKDWLFEPATLGGQPVEATIRVPFRFQS